jgi:hypothetical protein
MASVFGTPLVIRIHGDLYLFLVTSLEYIVTIHTKYFVVTWVYIEGIFPDLIWAVHLETSRQFVASVFGVVCSVEIVTITTFVISSKKSFL